MTDGLDIIKRIDYWNRYAESLFEKVCGFRANFDPDRITDGFVRAESLNESFKPQYKYYPNPYTEAGHKMKADYPLFESKTL